jgi:DtxR family Mn-dependent transcriptional regulator
MMEDSGMAKHDVLTRSMQDYLKAIFSILEKNERATTSVIAERMGIASPSATAMIKRLAQLRLVEHEPYQGVTLTQTGEKTALEIVRHHRLVELYLAKALGVPWDEVHAEAEELEHVISENLEDRIDNALGNPKLDPHGAPIPARDGSFVELSGRTLCDVGPGERVTVIQVDDRDPELLRYLAKCELYPGARIEVLAAEPYEGSLVLRLADKEFRLGRGAAREILVTSES